MKKWRLVKQGHEKPSEARRSFTKKQRQVKISKAKLSKQMSRHVFWKNKCPGRKRSQARPDEAKRLSDKAAKQLSNDAAQAAQAAHYTTTLLY